MPPRRPRLTLVQRLVSPVAKRVRRPIPRIRRQFPNVPPRWSLARRLFAKSAAPDRRDR